ncbi:MAG: DNA translocase FtsK 4TM domain-containing protein [Burkholderiales bacterium]|nr:DNA translocase FtsK 4TM domain-containing protein [Burkholderiales bacterium]
MVFVSYNKTDPAWSHSSAQSMVSNLGGKIGAYLADIFFYLLGMSAWWMIAWVAWLLAQNWKSLHQTKLAMFTEDPPNPLVMWIRTAGFACFLTGSMGIEALRMGRLSSFLPQGSGGVVGQAIAGITQTGFGFTGASLLFLLLLAVGFSLSTGISWVQVVENLGKWLEKVWLAAIALIDARADRKLGEVAAVKRQEKVVEYVEKVSKPVEADFSRPEAPKTEVQKPEPLRIEPVIVRIEPSPRVELEKQQPLFRDMPDSCLPALGLLDDAPPVTETVSAETLEYTSRLIEKKLSDFGVQVKVIAAMPGPVITRFEIEPAAGVKGSQIVNLARDLARALSLVSIRVVETISGKNLMGLELPNPRRQMVKLTEILGSAVYNNSSSALTMALGKDIQGKAVVADLAKMPHCLVAGTTGSGKSVGINAMILSLLYKSEPKEVRLILIDPKMLEMSVYEGIGHLLCPVVTDMRQASNALNWCVGEMERRYRLMSKMGVRNLAGYNQKIAEAEKKDECIPNPFSLTPDAPEPLGRLPNIVIVIDELADLMMVVGKKIEELIARLAQKARAAGIHLILATQRPSVDVITGLIKANIPTRIAFQVSSKIDSRTILDQMGAEALLGQGDMLYLPPGSGNPLRVHGAFVSDEEVHRVVEHIKAQGEPDYIDGILEGGTTEEGGSETVAGSVDGEKDALYDEAVGIVLKNRRASISFVQRHLRIGYNRAARLLESMEAAGLVSAMQSNGNREILVRAETGQD